MIHFFLTFGKNAADSPFGRALKDMGVEHRIFSDRISLRYHYRIWLLLVGWPRLGLFAFRSAWRSLRSNPRPDAVVVSSHLEVLIFALMRLLLLRRKPHIYLLGFIYTRRRNRLIDSLRRLYFSFVFSLTDGIICFSELEIERYRELFKGAADRFRYIPYGLYIHGYEEHARRGENFREGHVFSAGRSGRDYRTLFEVFGNMGHPLHVICDSEAALSGCEASPNITVLKDCYDECYVEELSSAAVVAVPLAVSDISAGQMVLVQAMAYRKPLVVTETPTIADYLTDGENALLVPRGDAKAMKDAIEKLLDDGELASRLADNAFRSYETRHSMHAFVCNLVNAVNLSEQAS